jgi:transposase
MGLYCGVDLHSTNSYVAVLDEQLLPVLGRRVPNRLEAILGALEPLREQVQAVAVESTFNWYWLVDGLLEAGYRVQLVNTSAVRQYEGLKYVDDRHDARWLARLLHLGILPTGYIYPKRERALRDLLRRRASLVRQRTANLLSVKNLYSRNTGVQVPASELKRLTDEQVSEQFSDPNIALSATSCMAVVRVLNEEIAGIEKVVLKEAKLRADFKLLETIPGIGQILALTIMYEAGSITRFSDAGHFCSYCRCVPSQHLSNGKVKGKGNVRNGNAHLSWAFTEAAHFAIRFEPLAKRFYERKKSRTNELVALRTISHKLARASFYVLRDQAQFQPERAFG